MRDYDKDNFTELDALLNKAAEKYNVELNGSITNFIGCTYDEIRDIMHSTLMRIVPETEIKTWFEQVKVLMA